MRVPAENAAAKMIGLHGYQRAQEFAQAHINETKEGHDAFKYWVDVKQNIIRRKEEKMKGLEEIKADNEKACRGPEPSNTLASAADAWVRRLVENRLEKSGPAAIPSCGRNRGIVGVLSRLHGRCHAEHGFGCADSLS
jgi:hypothetical protein